MRIRNKAVADGAVSFYLDHYVKARISKFAYGTTCSTDYDPNNPDHLSRRANMYVSVSGTRKLPGLFDVILPKVRSSPPPVNCISQGLLQ